LEAIRTAEDSHATPLTAITTVILTAFRVIPRGAIITPAISDPFQNIDSTVVVLQRRWILAVVPTRVATIAILGVASGGTTVSPVVATFWSVERRTVAHTVTKECGIMQRRALREHGTNFQVFFRRDGGVRIATRTVIFAAGLKKGAGASCPTTIAPVIQTKCSVEHLVAPAIAHILWIPRARASENSSSHGFNDCQLLCRRCY
jgi:hypothetical protein